MRIAVSSDMDEPVARQLLDELRRRGHSVLVHGALEDGGAAAAGTGAEPAAGTAERDGWAWSASAAARAVADGTADQAVVCCWTGTGASIAANKVAGVRAALCGDAYTAEGARKWNDANALALSLRTVSGPMLAEILDAWFGGRPSRDPEDLRNVARLSAVEGGSS
ncbi:RpiB/LacA/LacB family sugar-phosphate isomerase [Streptomyces sp. V4-01]|uniref:RpiB/LacA/LacB family sugar-phosphate isomerase n=1 Tax=Actinacidiphila polyblastidii TaxID=3110430 RepID=A0ABU7PCB8_9ACTN|nr:RpiB/LacA/LacB family sugar-phosphate isomerase [Streptomyces sp. V4-01]